jgi:hypothetical protein
MATAQRYDAARNAALRISTIVPVKGVVDEISDRLFHLI